MKVNKLSPDVYEIEDFVSLEERQEILEFCRSLDNEKWNGVVDGLEEHDFFYGKQYHGERPAVFEKIDERVRNLFSNCRYIGNVAVQRYKKNESMGVHKDNWLKDVDFHIRFGIAIYYNDDYEGGQIEYPDLKIVHKPKAGSLLMHGGNILHGTLPVISDSVRYFSTCFVQALAESPAVLNPEIFADIEESDGSSYT